MVALVMNGHFVLLDRTAKFPLDHPITLIGRDRTCEVRLQSSRVSRRHCCLTCDDSGGVFVRDLGSMNGIRINGTRVAEGRLLPGDVLTIAHLEFHLVSREEAGVVAGG